MTTGKKIQIADYNTIRTKVVGVVGVGSANSGYGYPIKSSAVTTKSRVRKSDWTNLGDDITNARRQQVGTDPTLLDLAVGSKVKSNATTQYYTRYDTLADQVVADRNLVNSTSTINITPVTKTFANDEPWYNLITATVTVEFDSEDNARFYFNAGGEIRFSSSRTDPSGANPNVNRARQNTSWSTLLTNITNGSGGYSIPRFGGRLPSAGTTPTNGENYYRLTGVYQQWYTASPPTTAPGTQLPDFGVNDFVIKARFPNINNRALIEFRVEWQDNFQADYKFDDGITGQFSLGVTLVKPVSFALAGFDGSFTEIETPEVTIDDISSTADTGPAVPDPPSYSFTQDKTAINETTGGIGNVVTYTVNTTNVIDGTVLYWRIFGTATANDFDPQTLTGSATVTNPYPDPTGTATIAITARSDATSEQSTSPENFTLRVYDTEAGRNDNILANRIVNTNQVTINDTSLGTPTLLVQTTRGSEVLANNAEVDEGTEVTYTVSTQNILNAATINFSISGASTADYSPGTSSGTMTVTSSDGGYSGTATLNRTIIEDNSPFSSPLISGSEPNPESMTVTFSYPGATSVTHTLRIRDTSFQPAPQPVVFGARYTNNSVYIGTPVSIEYTATNSSSAQWVTPSASPTTYTTFAGSSPSGSPDGCGPYADQVVTGTLSGSTVWGSNPYTDDSDFNVAAVHAGLISVGQTATIRKTSVGYLQNFTGTTRNGITTNNWTTGWCGVNISLASPGGSPGTTVTETGTTSFTTGSGGKFPTAGTYSTFVRAFSAFEPGVTTESATFNLTVLNPPPITVNSVQFSPGVAILPQGGGSVSSTLSWTTTNANYVSLGLTGYSGNYPANHSLTVSYSNSGDKIAIVTPRNGPAFPGALSPTTFSGPYGSDIFSVSNPPTPPAPGKIFDTRTNFPVSTSPADQPVGPVADRRWSIFMRNHAIWSGNGFGITPLILNYDVNFPSTGDYVFEYSVDDGMAVTLDNVSIIGPYSGFGSNPPPSVTLNVNAGTRRLVIRAVNSRDVAGVALVITGI